MQAKFLKKDKLLIIDDKSMGEYLLYQLALQFITGIPFPSALHIDSY